MMPIRVGFPVSEVGRLESDHRSIGLETVVSADKELQR
jgi:hypothetical protein